MTLNNHPNLHQCQSLLATSWLLNFQDFTFHFPHWCTVVEWCIALLYGFQRCQKVIRKYKKLQPILAVIIRSKLTVKQNNFLKLELKLLNFVGLLRPLLCWSHLCQICLNLSQNSGKGTWRGIKVYFDLVTNVCGLLLFVFQLYQSTLNSPLISDNYGNN